MAIYARTLEAVEDVAYEGVDSFNELRSSIMLDTDNLVDHVIVELSMVIKKLKSKQDEFLNMFGCKSTEEFEARVAAYYNYNNLSTFTGNALRNIVNDFKKAQDANSQKIRQLLDQMLTNLQNNDKLRQHLEQRVAEIYGDVLSKEAPEYFTQLIIAALSQGSLGGGGTLSIESSKVIKGGGKNQQGEHILEIAANAATPAFEQHLIDMEHEYKYGSLKNLPKDSEEYKTLNSYKQLLRGFPKKPKVSSNKATISLGVMWVEEMVELMNKFQSDPSKLKGSDELKSFNNKIKEKIISTLHIENSRFRDFAAERIDYMLEQDDLMFMVGTSYTQVEGILGEINTMIALSHLLGDKFTSKIVHWIGSQKVGTNKRQPSIDVVLGEIAGLRFGVQVKNTMANLDIPDIAHEIGFANKSIQETFNQLGVGTDAIENVYIADIYNVPFKEEGGKYVQVGYGTPFEHNDATAPFFHRYTEVDKLIDETVRDMNTFLTMFAPDFLYMGLGDDFRSKLATLDNSLDTLEGVGGNYVYIVGPKVYFAHDMLQKLVQQLDALKKLDNQEQQMNFKLEAYFGKLKGEKGSFNIVMDKNKYNFSDKVKHTIKMKSSWLFT